MGVTAPHSSREEAAVQAVKDLAVGQAAGVAQAHSNGSPARVPSRGLRPAPEALRRSVQVEAAGGEVAGAKAPGQGNKAEAEVSKLALALNALAPAETAQRVDTGVAVARGQTAPVDLTAVPEVAEGAEVTEAPAAGEAEAGDVEEAVVGVKARILNGDSLLQGV